MHMNTACATELCHLVSLAIEWLSSRCRIYLVTGQLFHCVEPLAAPENVQLETSEDKPSIFVTWSPVPKQCYNSDSLTGYHVLYTPSSKDCRGGTLEVLPDETSCSLDFLDRGVAYAVSVAAVNDIGIGPYSTPSVAIVGGMLYCAHQWQPPVCKVVHVYMCWYL